MDLRIVNTCNNNCKFCLEQDLRTKNNFINIDKVLKTLQEYRTEYPNDDVLSFYGGNSLSHPNLKQIILESLKQGFHNISLLTNSKNIKSIISGDEIFKNIRYSIYFNSFDSLTHKMLTQNIDFGLDKLLENISFLSQINCISKIIIHVNKQNIHTLYKDIYILYKKFGITHFEFINYYPFGRAYEYHKNLGYDIYNNSQYIKALFKVIEKHNLAVKFLKFPEIFFGENKEYYDFTSGIQEQISGEDAHRISSEYPICFQQRKCSYCFLQDICFSK